MTTAPAFLASLRGAGFEVFARGGRLFVTPRERLTAAEVERVTALKPALMALLLAERLEDCRVCRATVDPAAGEDVGRVCDQGGCPYRASVRRRC